MAAASEPPAWYLIPQSTFLAFFWPAFENSKEGIQKEHNDKRQGREEIWTLKDY